MPRKSAALEEQKKTGTHDVAFPFAIMLSTPGAVRHKGQHIPAACGDLCHLQRSGYSSLVLLTMPHGGFRRGRQLAAKAINDRRGMEPKMNLKFVAGYLTSLLI
jgi:hypothetical protein